MPPEVKRNKRAFFDISINGEPAGRIVFSLWNHCCPRTVENFRALYTGELGKLQGHYATYEGSTFHQVIKGFMIQGGDITHGNGQGGFSIYDRTFDDENLSVKHNKPYLLSMANRGPDTNGSQFFITTEEVPHLDGKHCFFGEVIEGIEVVQLIENLEVGDENELRMRVKIAHCGEMVREGVVTTRTDPTIFSEPEGVKMDDEPKTNNWPMRRSKSPESRDGKPKDKRSRDRSSDRHCRQRSPDRHGRDRRSRSRSPRDRTRGTDDRREERRTDNDPADDSDTGSEYLTLLWNERSGYFSAREEFSPPQKEHKAQSTVEQLSPSRSTSSFADNVDFSFQKEYAEDSVAQQEMEKATANMYARSNAVESIRTQMEEKIAENDSEQRRTSQSLSGTPDGAVAQKSINLRKSNSPRRSSSLNIPPNSVNIPPNSVNIPAFPVVVQGRSNAAPKRKLATDAEKQQAIDGVDLSGYFAQQHLLEQPLEKGGQSNKKKQSLFVAKEDFGFCVACAMRNEDIKGTIHIKNAKKWNKVTERFRCHLEKHHKKEFR